jgi:uncharacterized protein YcaQ
MATQTITTMAAAVTTRLDVKSRPRSSDGAPRRMRLSLAHSSCWLPRLSPSAAAHASRHTLPIWSMVMVSGRVLTGPRRPEGSLSGAEACRLALRAQGLHGEDRRPHSAPAALELVGALQLDTISVLARSHELVCWARCGPLPPGAVADACWGVDGQGRARAFEYWSHAASVLPIASWPWYAFRRRRIRAHQDSSDEATAEDVATDVIATVRHRLEVEGPLTATDLGGAKLGGQWWDWSPVKVALERLLARGDVVCTTRRGWKRVYDLTERAVPAALLQADPDDATCLRHLVADAGRRLGVGTVGDLADYFRLSVADVAGAVADTGLVAVTVEGWERQAWADPLALDELGRRGRHRTTLLSPFDSLIWGRPRTERVFGYSHRLEAYTPAAKRIHGYYAMPVLAGGRIVGRVDPGRDGSTLVAKRVGVIDAAATEAIADAMRSAAAWVGASSIRLEAVDPPERRTVLQAALDRTS